MSANDKISNAPAFHEDNDLNLTQSIDGEPKPKTRGGKGRRKIDIKYIEDKTRRQITFSKRKAGLMKKAYELSTLTGTQILVLVTSETGHVYTFATRKFQPFITDKKGKNLIQQCLSSDIETSEYEENEEEPPAEPKKDMQMPTPVMGGDMNVGHHFNQDYQRFNSMVNDPQRMMMTTRFQHPQQMDVMRQDAQWVGRHMNPGPH